MLNFFICVEKLPKKKAKQQHVYSAANRRSKKRKSDASVHEQDAGERFFAFVFIISVNTALPPTPKKIKNESDLSETRGIVQI